jgi:hypothetical protein
MLYTVVLDLHNLLRWVVLLAGLWALFRHLTGWLGKGGWLPADRRASRLFPIALDIEALWGILLYAGLSPLMRTVFHDFPKAMQVPELRIFAAFHAFGMLAALALAHVGKTRAGRHSDSVKKHKTLFLWYGVSFVLILAFTPWMRGLLPGIH